MNELLLRRRIAAIESGQPSPYDAKIEYIGCVRAQYINTLIITDQNASSYQIEMDLTINAGTSTIRYYCVSSTYNHFILLYQQRSSFYNQKDLSVIATAGNRYYIVAEITPTYRTLQTNGGQVTQKNDSRAFDNGDTIYLLGLPGATGGNAYLHSCIIKKDGVDIFNAYPVRVGQVGYLYDTISGQLFGNAGTGSFSIGNDVN